MLPRDAQGHGATNNTWYVPCHMRSIIVHGVGKVAYQEEYWPFWWRPRDTPGGHCAPWDHLSTQTLCNTLYVALNLMWLQSEPLYWWLSQPWHHLGIQCANSDREAVELWAARKDLTLLHDVEDPTSFQSAHWKRGHNPDLALNSYRNFLNIDKSVGNPLPRIHHRPIIIDI